MNENLYMAHKIQGTNYNSCFFFLFLSPQLSYSSDLSVNAVKVFEVLVNYLVAEHIDYAVELGLLGEIDGL